MYDTKLQPIVVHGMVMLKTGVGMKGGVICTCFTKIISKSLRAPVLCLEHTTQSCCLSSLSRR